MKITSNNLMRYISFFIVLIIFSCEDKRSSDTGVLFINEFLSKNDSCCPDEAGDYDDWVELYNSGSSPIDVGGMYITDDLEDELYRIPKTDNTLTTVPGEGYLILWLDKDEEQGPQHIGVKLSTDGESIILFASDSKTIIDSFSFEAQEADISMGRSPDGSNNWVKFTTPTPGSTNK